MATTRFTLLGVTGRPAGSFAGKVPTEPEPEAPEATGGFVRRRELTEEQIEGIRSEGVTATIPPPRESAEAEGEALVPPVEVLPESPAALPSIDDALEGLGAEQEEIEAAIEEIEDAVSNAMLVRRLEEIVVTCLLLLDDES